MIVLITVGSQVFDDGPSLLLFLSVRLPLHLRHVVGDLHLGQFYVGLIAEAVVCQFESNAVVTLIDLYVDIDDLDDCTFLYGQVALG